MHRLPATIAFVFATSMSSVDTSAQEAPLLLEYPEGPVVNSNRVIGLGGAYVGVAEGADGHLYNPASFAYRYNYTRNDIWDWDWSLYWLNMAGDGKNPDLYGEPGETDETTWFGGGLDLKIAGFGGGFHAYTQSYDLGVPDGTIRTVSNTSFGLGLAYALHTLDITLGAYVYGFVWALTSEDTATNVTTTLLSTTGAGSRVGLLWAPRHRPVRIGLVYRSAFNATGVRDRDDTIFQRAPDGVYLPGQISIGGSFLAWEKRYNPNMTWGLKGLEDERPAQPGDELRRYVMFAYDLVLKEPPPPGTLSMRGYLSAQDRAVPIRNDLASIGFRFGVESEVWANWLVLRGGYYFEPPRTITIAGRHHGTAGFAFRLPVTEVLSFWPWDLRLDSAVDVAVNYLNFGVGMGFWH